MNVTELALEPPAEIERVQTQRLRAMLELAARAHPAYRRRWAEAGLDPTGVRTLADVARLPLTRKADVSASPTDYQLETARLPAAETLPWDTMYTAGSTGAPVPFASTSYDHYATLALQARVCRIRGITGEDTIANLFPYTPRPHGAFTRCSEAAGVIGARLVLGGAGRSYGPDDVHRTTPEVLETLQRAQPTVLWGIVSYLRRLLVEAEATGVRLEDVRMCAVSGEPLSPAMRADVVERLERLGSAGVVVNDSLGATEMQAGLVECADGAGLQGLHNPSPELFLLETVEEDGVPVAEGETGLLALTHLDRRGTVLFRYLTGDRVALTREPCPICGRAGGRIVSPPRRVGSMVKIRGQLVDSGAILAAVEEAVGAVDFEVRVTRSDPADPLSMDLLLVRLFDDDADTDLDGIARLVKDRTNLLPQVEQVAARWGGDTMKVARWIDEREAS